MGNEVREYGVDVLLGPALNTHRNPLGGRNFEYYSEDPLVSGRMTAAMVKGVQAEGVGTSIKHFVANDHEWNRNTIDVKVSQRALREIYLRGFEIGVRESAPWTVMSSYNKLNGSYTSESQPLLTGVLRTDWAFSGLVMTDWFGGRDAVAQMNAGNDLLMPGTANQQKALLAALESGQLKEEVLDRNVARVLELVLRSPAFHRTPHSDAPDLKAHAQVAREAAAEGMVLLRNEGGALPLAKAGKLALLGNTSYAMITGGTGSGDVNKAYSVSLAEGLKAAGFSIDGAVADAYAAYLAEEQKKQPAGRAFQLPPPIPERATAADEIGRLARESDLALVTIGRRSGEFVDRKKEGDFELADAERTLLKDVAAAFHAQKKKVIVVLNVGGVIETASWRELPDAILLAWQPGQESGNAIADVLHGAHAAVRQARDHLPGAVGGRPVLGRLPREGAGGARPERPGAHVPRRARGRGDLRRRHLGRLPALRDEGREGRVPVRLRALVHPLPLLGPAPERQDVRREAHGHGHGDERRHGAGARGRAALPVGPRQVHAQARAGAAGLRQDEAAEARRVGDALVHAGAARPRLVRRGVLVVGGRSRDVHREGRCLQRGHPADGDVRARERREGRRGLDLGRIPAGALTAMRRSVVP